MRKAPPPAPRTVEKRAQPGRLRAIALAVLVHAAFFSLIVFGVRWQSSPSVPLEAELWDKLPPVSTKAAAAKPAPAPEPPKPEPAPEPPRPEPPKVEPPKPAPPKPEVKPEPPKPDPAIAQKLEREKREKEKRERLERQREEEVKKQREEKAKKEKEEQVRKQREREEVAQKKREEEERARQEAEKRRVAAQAQEAAAKARQTEIDSWTSKIKKKIRDRANIPDTVTGHPKAEFRIRILPGGEVLDVTLTKSSGNRAYDAAIERGIRSASPLPVPDPSSELFPQFREPNLIFEHDR